MKKIWISLTAAALLAASALTVRAADALPSLTTTGTGSVIAAADTATLYVVVETADKDAKKATQDNAAVSAKVWDAALAAGASREASATSGYNLYPEYEGNNQQKLKTYHVKNAMKVTVKDPSIAGAVSDAAVKAGATRISSVSFSLENEEPYRERALTMAVQAARQKAEVIAAGLGCTITGVRAVQIGSVDSSVYNVRQYAAADALAGGGAQTDLTPTRQEITSEVTVTFDIE